MRIKRLLVDPIKNSTYLYHKNCVADSKENYKLDPGVKRLTSTMMTLFQKDYVHNYQIDHCQVNTHTFSSLISILLVSTTNLSISASRLSLNSLNMLLETPVFERQKEICYY